MGCLFKLWYVLSCIFNSKGPCTNTSTTLAVTKKKALWIEGAI